MSYIRAGWSLDWFDGEFSEEYVFGTEQNGEPYIEDYGSDYDHDPSFIALIMSLVGNETHDEKYAIKIGRVLAEKLGVKMRSKPKSRRQVYKETMVSFKEFNKNWERAMDPNLSEEERNRAMMALMGPKKIQKKRKAKK